ncbi:MAG TPA: hypothetical protein VFK02_06110 [Kofleriaceae bacterium]|nr:hypothetical protein [Kofleriaceae bacterium]
MRWLGVLALLGGCGGMHADPPGPGGVALVLDIPNGPLDPKGFTTVEIVLHGPTGDETRTASVGTGNTFDLGTIDPTGSVSIEATLRNDSGAAVGYGRTAVGAAFTGGAQITVPVRRPIAYIAGTVSNDISPPTSQTPELHWTEAPATFSDLSVTTNLDGKTQLGGPVVLMVSAGPNLYSITQAVGETDGVLTGPAKLVPVSTADHTASEALAGAVTGGVLDGAGTVDGTQLVIGTTTQLFAVDTRTGAATALTDGSFARVAVLTSEAGEVDAVAIKNRSVMPAAACPASAELWWAPVSGGPAGVTAHRVAIGGFTDLATDRGHAYFVDACKGELGELTSDGIRTLRTLTAPGAAAGAARATALAVSNGQAYVGVETPPATTSLLVASMGTTDEPRTLWNESAQQVLDAPDFPGVERKLDASSATFNHLEVGAGGDYVALTTTAHLHGGAVTEANFPEMTIDTDELRVFDAATGGAVQRYRSWCDGVFIVTRSLDIDNWECAATVGQTEPADGSYEHKISSMTFQFGKK